MKSVITYSVPSTGSSIDLCIRHSRHTDSDEVRAAAGGPLGPVSHGRHEGTCDVCRAAAAQNPDRGARSR